jgi:Polyketide cyclase / dehydrase and lipid transport
VGSRCTTTRRIGGAERTPTQEVTKLDPPRAWSVRGVDGPVRANVDVTVEPLDERTRSRVSISLQFVGHGIGKLIVSVFVRPQAGKEVASSCQNLKARLERSGD